MGDMLHHPKFTDLVLQSNSYYYSNNNRGYRGPLLNILNIQEAIPNKFILCHLGI